MGRRLYKSRPRNDLAKTVDTRMGRLANSPEKHPDEAAGQTRGAPPITVKTASAPSESDAPARAHPSH